MTKVNGWRRQEYENAIIIDDVLIAHDDLRQYEFVVQSTVSYDSKIVITFEFTIARSLSDAKAMTYHKYRYHNMADVKTIVSEG